jgi:hypothetical protein
MNCDVIWCFITGSHVLMGASSITSHNFTGGPAFAASRFRAWLRTLLQDISQPMRRYCFMSWFVTPSMNAYAAPPLDEVSGNLIRA